MTLLPATCRSCGYQFPIQNMVVGNVALTLKGGRTRCPRCKGIADIQDGDYSIEGDVVTYLSGPGITFGALRAASAAVRASQAAGESPEQTLARATVEIPALAALKGRARSTAAWVLLTALAYLGGKFADRWVDPIVKPAENHAALHAVVKDAVREALNARELAAKSAGVVEPSAHGSEAPTAQRVPSVKPSGPGFPKSMEKLQRQMRERYSNQSRKGMAQRKDRERDQEPKRADAQHDQKDKPASEN